MKTNRSIIHGGLFISIMMLLASCADTVTQTIQVPTIHFKQDKSKKMASCFNHFSFVQLENNEDAFIPKARKAMCMGDTVVVQASNDGVVYTFNKHTGKCIAQIGTRGEGPEEYTEASEFFITQQHEIAILDRLRNRVSYYTANGRHLRNENTATNLAWMIGAEKLADNRLFVYNKLTGGYPRQDNAFTLSGLGSDATVKTFDSFAPVKVGNYCTSFADRPATSYGDGVTYFKFLNDTIFHYDGSKEEPVYKLNFVQPFPSKETVGKMGNYESTTLFKLNKESNYFIGLNKIFETDGIVILEPNIAPEYGRYWIDKETGTGYYCPSTRDVGLRMKMVYTGKIVGDIVGASSKGLICTLDEWDMKEIKKMADKRNKPFDKRLASFVNSINGKGNICLLFYEH